MSNVSEVFFLSGVVLCLWGLFGINSYSLDKVDFWIVSVLNFVSCISIPVIVIGFKPTVGEA